MGELKTFLLLLVVVAGAAAQTITTYAGNGSAGYNGDGFAATQASINRVVSLATDNAGNLYLAEELNHRVRRIDRNGLITTLAGTGAAGFSGDSGPANQAQLNQPLGVCTDAFGNVFVNDNGNKRIRKISTIDGTIATIFGNGSATHSGDGGSALQAGAQIPIRCATDRAGNVYFVDQGAHRVRKVSTGGIVTTIGGNGTQGFSGDGGAATAAAMNNPTAIVADTSDNLYITDQFNHRIRMIDTNGNIQTVAGNGTAGFSGDRGSATAASLNFPGSVAVDSNGVFWIVDSVNQRIRKVSGGTIDTIAGTGASGFSGDGGAALQATFNGPFAIALDSGGNLYIGDTSNNRIRKISGATAGTGNGPVFNADGVTNAASFQTGVTPGGIVTIFGSNLGAPAGQVVAAPGAPWPVHLSGTSVTIDGVAAPIYRVLNLNGSEQLSFQAPFSIAGKNSVGLSVSTANGQGQQVTVNVYGAQPGIFILDSDGTGAVHASGSPAGSANPAARGETLIIYLTGLGPVNNSPATGDAASSTTLAPTLITPQVVIGGFKADIAFSGLAPGFIGLYQINAVVPPATPVGTVDLTVAANGITSNTAKLVVK